VDVYDIKGTAKFVGIVDKPDHAAIKTAIVECQLPVNQRGRLLALWRD
jgi:hypothetical protein